MSVMQGAPAYMNMPTIRGVGGLEVTTTIQHQTPRLGIRTGKRFHFLLKNHAFGWVGGPFSCIFMNFDHFDPGLPKWGV